MEVSSGVGVMLGGLNLNDREAGSGYRTMDLDGWWEPTGSTGQAEQNTGGPGAWLGEAHPMGRRIVATGSIDSGSHAESAAMLVALWRALPVSGVTPFVVSEGAVPLHAMVRQEDRPDVDWLTDTYVTFNFQLHSPEWRRLAGDGTAPSRRTSVGLPLTSGGRIRPYSLPSQIDAQVVAGSVPVENRGSAPPEVIVTFRGPVRRPVVRSATTGNALMFDLEVLRGQSLVVDLGKRTALLNGVSRRGRKRGTWLTVPVEGDTLIFDAEAYSLDARMTVDQTEAWK